MSENSFPNIEFQMVTEGDQLHAMCEQFAKKAWLAVDTEFIRTDTYYPKLGLLQFNDGENCFLVDPLALNDLEPLRQLFVNPDITKVFHSCSEDLEAIQSFFQVLPVPMFDTQLAAAFAGFGSSIGYRNIVSQLCEVELNKDSTRSDWLKRPLSDMQLSYATLDVEYLLPIVEQLRERLSSEGKLAWFEEEQSGVIDKYLQGKREERYYLRVKSAWRLSPSQLSILQRLCQWREQTAKKRDLPRGRVVKDQALLDIASAGFNRVEDLSKVDDLFPKTIKRYGQQIIDLVNACASLSPDQYPNKLPAPLSPAASKKHKAAKRLLADIAEETGIVRELLMPKKDLEATVRSGLSNGQYQLPVSLVQWRRDLLEEPLLKCLSAGA